MKTVIFCILALIVSTASAQLLPVEQTGPTIEVDEHGHDKKMDFNTPLVGISDQGLKFSNFSDKPLLIYYFSAKCPHCQKSYPKIQKLSDTYTPKGLTSIAVAVSQNKKADLRTFTNDLGVRIPMLQDSERTFSTLYGSGSVPLVVLVMPNGKYIRYTNVHSEMNYLEDKLKEMFK